MICEYCSDVNCRFRNLIGDYCNDYKPKEKQMENKLQITEEYAREIYRAGVFINPDGSMENEYVRLLKEKGYIRKSAVEEAEEVYNEWFNCHTTYIEDLILANNNLVLFNDIIRIQHEAIQEQKKEIENLKDALARK